MTTIKDRNLPERSKLVFEFPKPQRGGGKFVVTVPFFENIKISESKRAKYVKYDLLSRSSQLYTYTGAESRKFTLDFVMCFPHILEQSSPANFEDYVSFVASENDAEQRRIFKSPTDKVGTVTDQRLFGSAEKLTTKFRESVNRPTLQDLNETLQTLDIALPALFFGTKNPNVILQTKHYDFIDLIMYWTNIIRSSVTNNSENPIYGPPVVRINHGILFQNIPCICTDYTIEPIEEGGYDLGTLLPRRIRYTMNLEELRAGDFGKFSTDRKEPIKRDNLVGWEAVVSNPHQSMDPGYDL